MSSPAFGTRFDRSRSLHTLCYLRNAALSIGGRLALRHCKEENQRGKKKKKKKKKSE